MENSFELHHFDALKITIVTITTITKIHLYQLERRMKHFF